MISLLEYIPGWVFHLALLFGVVSAIAGLILNYIPLFNKYKVPALVVGTVFIALGLFTEGIAYSNQQWKLKMADVEIASKQIEANSAKANAELTAKIAELSKRIREKQIVVRHTIEQAAPVLNAACKIPQEAIAIHNNAAVYPNHE